MYLFSTRSGTAPALTGRIYKWNPGETTATSLTLPSNVRCSSRRPCHLFYKGRGYHVGMFSSDLTIDEEFGVWLAGLPAPNRRPTLATSGTGITGNVIGYFTFVHMVNGRIVQESDLSKASATLALSNQGVAWSNIPTSCPANSRATHVSGYRSVDGGLPRRAWIRPLGPTTVTENVPTATLANLTAAPVDTAGDLDVNARGVPLPALFGVIWHDRMWRVVAGKRGVYYSKLFEPDSQNPTGFIDCRDGEQPTGLGIDGDELVVFYTSGAYAISGFGVSDFSMRKISTQYGCISHHSIVNVQGVLVFASDQGISARQGGSFRNLMARSYRNSWISAYTASASAYEDSVGTYDQEGHYRLLIPAGGLEYVANMRPVLEEGALDPYWSLDKYTRTTRWIGLAPYSSTRQQLRYAQGADDGFIRVEDSTDDDDDSDSYAKLMKVRHKHFFFGDQSGSLGGARTYHFLDWFGVNTADAVTLKAYGGDDDAASAAAPQWTETVSAVSNTSFVKQTSFRLPTPGLAGKGVTVEMQASSPVGVEHRGFGIEFDPNGPQTRPAR